MSLSEHIVRKSGNIVCLEIESDYISGYADDVGLEEEKIDGVSYMCGDEDDFSELREEIELMPTEELDRLRGTVAYTDTIRISEVDSEDFVFDEPPSRPVGIQKY